MKKVLPSESSLNHNQLKKSSRLRGTRSDDWMEMEGICGADGNQNAWHLECCRIFDLTAQVPQLQPYFAPCWSAIQILPPFEGSGSMRKTQLSALLIKDSDSSSSSSYRRLRFHSTNPALPWISDLIPPPADGSDSRLRTLLSLESTIWFILLSATPIPHHKPCSPPINDLIPPPFEGSDSRLNHLFYGSDSSSFRRLRFQTKPLILRLRFLLLPDG
jgi:hypothetical protein